MPELPEVEVVVRSLDTIVRGRRIVSAALYRKLLAPALTAEQFASLLGSRKILSVARRGKHILFDLSRGKTLITHLRMSGRFRLLNGDAENPRFTHAEFRFSDGNRLVFQDQRHFGYMNLVKTEDLFDTPELKKLAPEPFAAGFSAGYLKHALGGSRRAVKEFLLDQTKVCGLGNIYASEALFLARINPAVPANEISTIKSKRLHSAIRSVLSEAIEIALSNPLDAENIENRYFNGSSGGDWLVYDREGKPCRKCDSVIRRVKQGARSSYFCPRCQRK